MNFERIERNETRVIGDIALKALQAAFAEHNIEVKPARGSFLHTFCELKFQFSLRNADGSVESREAQEFKQLAVLYGLKPEDLGRTFLSRGEMFRITGLSPRGSKMPILTARVSDGKGFKFAVSIVKLALGVKEVSA